MAYEDLKYINVAVQRRVAWVTIDYPPINLMDPILRGEFNTLIPQLSEDSSVSVVVFQSANPEFFIAHGDLTTIGPAVADLGISANQAARERLRTMPKITIAKIEGRVRGGGAETVLSMDMRFAARGSAILSQPEVMLGLSPGGTSTQRLPRLMGRSRALEVLLGCEDFDADLAERYGYVNRALDADEIGPFVEQLAYRIASFPAETLALTKASVLATELNVLEGLQEELRNYNENLTRPDFDRRREKYLKSGGQTREAELDLAAWAQRLED
jgi:enoyl-CoA hydratase/carnithine racemase